MPFDNSKKSVSPAQLMQALITYSLILGAVDTKNPKAKVNVKHHPDGESYSVGPHEKQGDYQAGIYMKNSIVVMENVEIDGVKYPGKWTDGQRATVKPLDHSGGIGVQTFRPIKEGKQKEMEGANERNTKLENKHRQQQQPQDQQPTRSFHR